MLTELMQRSPGLFKGHRKRGGTMQVYKLSARGRALVSSLVEEGFAVSREDASILGNRMCSFNLLENMVHSKLGFLDNGMIYQLVLDEKTLA